ncbi:hypothetical protein PG997_012321 [Apiospora hydei]|uniref:Uncharacterized protein n=1 Tax=Apiospora hydei TaxID=1337664 RepID=A0ABR1V317_9PEZI
MAASAPSWLRVISGSRRAHGCIFSVGGDEFGSGVDNGSQKGEGSKAIGPWLDERVWPVL